MIEIAYEGEDRDRAEWEDENSVLHSAYLGNGQDFYAVDRPAFMTLYRTNSSNSDGDIAFITLAANTLVARTRYSQSAGDDAAGWNNGP